MLFPGSNRVATREHLKIYSVIIAALLSCSLFSIRTLGQGGRSQKRPEQKDPQIAGLNPAAQNSLETAIQALKSGALSEAERAARIAVQASPKSPITRNLLGVVLDRLGKHEAALDAFDAAIRLDPDFVSARNNRGRLFAERGKFTEAIAEFERVLKVEPSHLEAHYNLGSLYAAAGDFAKATEHLAVARSNAPDDPQLTLAFIDAAYRAKRTEEAEAAADLFEKRGGQDPRALFTLAMTLARSEQYERGARLFGRVNEMMPDTFEVLYNLGIALYNLDRGEEAAQHLAKAADINPAPAETHFRLGLIASERSDHANAVEEFKHAIERNSGNANYHYLLGREYFRAGFLEGAISEFTRAIEIAPNQDAYFLARADANYRKGEALAAAADFDRAAAINAEIKDIEYWQGYAYRVAGKFDLARKYLESFLTKNPKHADTLASLGFVAIEQGRLEDAETVLSRALELAPNDIAILYDFARVAFKRRDYEGAVVRLKRALEKQPGLTEAHYQLFLAYTRLKQTDNAQKELAEFKRLEALRKQADQERMLDDKLRTQRMLGGESTP